MRLFKKLRQNEKFKEKFLPFIVFLFAAIFATLPYLDSGTIFGHDLVYHLNRIQSSFDEIEMGNFPVFIHSELLDGLGYGNPLYYPDLFLMIPMIFLKMGLGVLTSYKLFILIITFATGLIMYYSAKVIFKDRKVSYFASFLYIFSMYRFIDVYARAALGEILALTFLPLVIAGVYDVIYGDNKRWYLIAFGLFGIMNSHILSTLIILILLIILIVININVIFKDKKKILNIFIAGIVSIMIVSSFVLPYLEQRFSSTVLIDVHKNSAESLEANACGVQEMFDNTIENTDTYTSKGIGILLLAFPILIILVKDKDKRAEHRFMVQVTFLGYFFVFVSTNLFPWEKAEMLQIIQFPFRFNMLSTLLLSLGGAYAFINSSINKDDLFNVGIVLTCIFVAKYLNTVKINPHLITYEILMSGPKIANGEYKPIELNVEDNHVYNTNDGGKNRKIIPHNKEKGIVTFKYEDNDYDFDLNVPLAYYKGYYSYIETEDGVKHELKVDKNTTNGMVVISSDENYNGTVYVYYKMTPIQKTGYIITILTIVGTMLYIINKKED